MNYSDQFFMKIALSLAKKGIGRVSPNPPVGALVVKNNKIIGRGYHRYYGGPHAEVYALQKLSSEDLKDATLYVTLEPCSHYGKTPPCAKLIAERGLKRVVIAVRDRNPLVSGRGIEIMKEKGIEVSEGVLKDELELFYRPFFKYITEKMPFVTLKVAQSLDGKNSFERGTKYLVSEHTLKFVHRLRYQSDAILVGINTVISDNPSLDIRHYYLKKKLIKVVLDTTGRIKGDERLFHTSGDVIIFTANGKLMDKRVKARIELVELQNGRLNLKKVFRKLAEMKLQNILVEGGGTLSFQLIKENLVDRLILIQAPIIIGGNRNLSFSGDGFQSRDEALFLKSYNVKKSGDDLIFIWDRF